MVKTKFYCEYNSERYLNILDIEKNTICFNLDDDDDDGDCMYVELTIEDVELLIIELQRAINKKLNK